MCILHVVSPSKLNQLGLRFPSDPYSSTSLVHRARRRGWAAFIERFPDLQNMRVVDLGGWPEYWEDARVKPAHVTVVNVEHHSGDWPNMDVMTADVCSLPSAITDREFDLVHSNSVIEHSGGHDRCKRFAEAVHSLAKFHWVQTPAKGFPLEPHWLFPGFQYLPICARVKVTEHWPLDYLKSAGDSALENVLSVQLLSAQEFRYYFPISEILRERVFGLCKSFVAVSSPDAIAEKGVDS